MDDDELDYSFEPAMTLDDVAEELGLSKERVRQIEARAFYKIKKSGLLNDFVSVIKGGRRSRNDNDFVRLKREAYAIVDELALARGMFCGSIYCRSFDKDVLDAQADAFVALENLPGWRKADTARLFSMSIRNVEDRIRRRKAK